MRIASHACAVVISTLAFLTLPFATARADETTEVTPAAAASGRLDTTSGRSNFERRPLALLVTLGLPLGSPVGLFGFELEYAPRRWLALTAGGGLGVAGPQEALGARGRYVLDDHLALGLGASASHGPFTAVLFCHDAPGGCGQNTVDLLWLNTDVGVESRTTNGFTVRGSLGLSTRLACTHGDCAAARPSSAPSLDRVLVHDRFLPYTSVSLGYAF